MTEKIKALHFVNEGDSISPLLPEEVKNYLIDIDGTVCEDIPNEQAHRMADAAVYPDALAIVNGWYEQGHIITFFTSRTDEHREVTAQWLDKNGFNYHHLLLNKPRGGNYHWIDNCDVKATRFNGSFTELVKQTKAIEVFDDGE
jgi:hypothetical protein